MSLLDHETVAFVDPYVLEGGRDFYDLDDEEHVHEVQRMKQLQKIRQRTNVHQRGFPKPDGVYVDVETDRQVYFTHVVASNKIIVCVTNDRKVHICDQGDAIPLTVVDLASGKSGAASPSKKAEERISLVQVDPLGRHVFVTMERSGQTIHLALKRGSTKVGKHTLDFHRHNESISSESSKFVLEAIGWNRTNTFEATTGNVLLGGRTGGQIWTARFDMNGMSREKRLFTLPHEKEPITGIISQSRDRSLNIFVATPNHLYCFEGEGSAEAILAQYGPETGAHRSEKRDEWLPLRVLSPPDTGLARTLKLPRGQGLTLISYPKGPFLECFVWAHSHGLCFGHLKIQSDSDQPLNILTAIPCDALKESPPQGKAQPETPSSPVSNDFIKLHHFSANGYALFLSTEESINGFVHPCCIPWQPLPHFVAAQAAVGSVSRHKRTGSGGSSMTNSFASGPLSRLRGAAQESMKSSFSLPSDELGLGYAVITRREVENRETGKFSVASHKDQIRQHGGVGVTIDGKTGKMYRFTPNSVADLKLPRLRQGLIPLFISAAEQYCALTLRECPVIPAHLCGSALLEDDVIRLPRSTPVAVVAALRAARRFAMLMVDALDQAEFLAGKLQSLRDEVDHCRVECLLALHAYVPASKRMAKSRAIDTNDALLRLLRAPQTHEVGIAIESYVRDRMEWWDRERRYLNEHDFQMYCLSHWAVLLMVDRCNRLMSSERSYAIRSRRCVADKSDNTIELSASARRAATEFRNAEGIAQVLAARASMGIQSDGAQTHANAPPPSTLEEHCRAAEAALGSFLHTQQQHLDFVTIATRVLGMANAQLITLLCVLLRQFDDVMKLLVLRHETDTASRLLVQYCDSKEYTHLWRRHGKVLMRYFPVRLVRDGLIPNLEPLQLSPPADHLFLCFPYQKSFNEVDPLVGKCRDDVVIEFLLKSIEDDCSTLDVVHNYTVVRLAVAGTDEQLERFLKDSRYVNLQFALRQCTIHTRIKACIQLYMALGLHMDAIRLALRNNFLDIAKRCASEIENDAQRATIWRLIARFVSGRQAGSKNSLLLLNESRDISVYDVLPHFSDDVMISEFQDELVASVKDFSRNMTVTNENATKAQRVAKMVRDDIVKQDATQARMPADKKCDVCEQPVLSRGAGFIVFPTCFHAFHFTCFEHQCEKLGVKPSMTRESSMVSAFRSSGRECYLCSKKALRKVLTAPLEGATPF